MRAELYEVVVPSALDQGKVLATINKAIQELMRQELPESAALSYYVNRNTSFELKRQDI